MTIVRQTQEQALRVVAELDHAAEKRREDREERVRNLLIGASVAGGSAAGAFLLRNSPGAQSYLQSKDWISTLNRSASPGSKTGWQDIKTNPTITFSDFLLDATRKLEEYSPFGIGRTFDLSHLITPFALGDNVTTTISGKSVAIQSEYLSKILGTEITSRNKAFGFKVVGGDVFEIMNKNGDLGRLIKSDMRIAFTEMHASGPQGDNRARSFKNAIIRRYADIHGVDPEFNFRAIGDAGEATVTIVGSDTHNWARAYARTRFNMGVKVFNAPADHMVDYLGDNKFSRWIRPKVTVGMGAGSATNLGIRASLGRMAVNIPKVTAGVLLGYHLLDQAVQKTAPSDSYYEDGIVPGILQTYANTRIRYAELVSDHFQDYKNTQEHVAPGSTSLTSIAGFALAGAMAAGTYSYGKRLHDSIRHGAEYANTMAYTENPSLSSDPNSIFNKSSIGRSLNRSRARSSRFALKGALVGLAVAAPFIPGALIGDSSDELSSIYSGEKEVAIKANRWWFSGGSEYGGTHTKYFAKHFIARTHSGARTASLYGDKETQADMNPFLSPLKYLRDPYAFEKLHVDDRPYSVWGMDVSYGSFLGKAFEKTIGQLIKPDIINPMLSDYLTSEDSGTMIHNTDTMDGRVEATSAAVRQAINSPDFNLTLPISDRDKSLIKDGLMRAPLGARYDPIAESVTWSYGALKDFIGATGFTISLGEEVASIKTGEVRPQLARSGEATNIAREFKDLNIGGAFGLTEAQRRLLPTNAGSIYQRVNPLKNLMPSWMPDETDSFHIDFTTGDPYTKIESGIYRLPGAGYEAQYRELSGLSAEDYPDIYKMKILSDVALGSRAYYDIKKRIEAREKRGVLTDYEQGMLATIREQEVARSIRRNFTEKKTEEDLEGVGIIGRAANAYWETATRLAESNPLENVSFFRPAAKLLHQRTAVEDYEKTQIRGSDLAMWNKPIKDFLAPLVSNTVAIVNDDYIPESTETRRNVEEYFDALEYVKQRRIYKEAISSGDSKAAYKARQSYQKTVVGAISSDIDNERELLAAYIALPSRERPYFGSFSEADSEQRDRIRSIVPKTISQLYDTIWSRKDTMQTAAESGENIRDAINRQIQEENDSLKEVFSSEYAEYAESGKSAGTFKEFLADINAERLITDSTGMPDDDFIGWDPRIDTEEIKLRAISLGGEDMHDYGFWKSDMERLSRLIAVMNEDQVTGQMEEIKEGVKKDRRMKNNINASLTSQGYEVRNLSITESGKTDIMINAQVY